MQQSKSVLKVNGKDALSYNLYADYKDGKVYMQIPELSDAYLDYSNLGDVDGQVNYVKAAGAVMDKVAGWRYIRKCINNIFRYCI